MKNQIFLPKLNAYNLQSGGQSFRGSFKRNNNYDKSGPNYHENWKDLNPHYAQQRFGRA